MSTDVAARMGAPQSPVVFRAVPGGLPLGAILAGIAGLAALAVGLLHLDALPFTVCFFKLGTGWPCVTCGSTRALGRLFHGDLAGAWLMNPLAAVGVLALLPWGAADLALLPRGRSLGLELSPAAGRIVRTVAIAAVVANWVYLVAAGR
jgi:uncharacterized protein DUF2752